MQNIDEWKRSVGQRQVWVTPIGHMASHSTRILEFHHIETLSCLLIAKQVPDNLSQEKETGHRPGVPDSATRFLASQGRDQRNPRCGTMVYTTAHVIFRNDFGGRLLWHGIFDFFDSQI